MVKIWKHLERSSASHPEDVLSQDLHSDVFGRQGMAVSLAPCPEGLRGGNMYGWYTCILYIYIHIYTYIYIYIRIMEYLWGIVNIYGIICGIIYWIIYGIIIYGLSMDYLTMSISIRTNWIDMYFIWHIYPVDISGAIRSGWGISKLYPFLWEPVGTTLVKCLTSNTRRWVV